MFLVQGAQSLAGASVTGVVRDTGGKPLGGMRVAAMATSEAGGTNTLMGIAMTDQTGRYRLEVPAGPYFIIEGRVEKPTYYPGVRSPEGAAVMSLASGSATTGLDFVVFAVAGFVRNPRGEPLPDVRVSAIEASSEAGVRSGADGPKIIGKTDDTGHYFLEVPPGRYYVSAGPISRATYYSGASDARNAASIPVGPGAASNGLDFVISEERLRTQPEDLYLLGMERMEMGIHAEAQLLFQTFIRTYPDNEYLPQAKYALADLLYREGTSEAMTIARTLFEEYVRLFPNAPQVAETRQRLTDIQQKTGRKDP